MKKSLILLTLISSIALAQTETETTATMNISAEVIKPLNVEIITHIDLGKIITGTSASAQGEYKVTGEPEAKYTAYIKELGKTTDQGTIKLVNKNNSNITLPVLVWTDYLPSLGPITLSKGENIHTIGAHVTVPKEQPSGQYESKVTMIVRYE